MAYIYDLSDTWNAAGTTFFGIKMNVTNSASASGSRLLSLQVASTEYFGVDKNGNVGIGITPSTKLDVAGAIWSRPGGSAGALASLTADASSGANGITLSASFVSGGYGPIKFDTGGSERMRIDSSGNLGIGTSSPGARLDVRAANIADGTNGGIINVYSTTAQAVNVGGKLDLGGLYDGSNSLSFASVAGRKENSTSGDWSGYMQFSTRRFGGDFAERMRINSSGNIGIGTSSPTSRLTITGGTTEIRDGNYLQFRPSGNGWDMRLQATGTQLDILSGGSLSSPIMSLLHGGNVGVGTNSPGSKFDVAGNILLSGQSTADQYIRIGSGRSGNGYSYLDFQGDTTYSNGLRLIRTNGGANSASNIEHRGTGALQLITQEAGPIAFFTSAAERARITSGGNFLVGTTSPAAGNWSHEIKDTTTDAWPLALNATTRGMVIRNSSASSGYYAYFEYNGGTNNGSISWSGGTTSYNTTSDARIKQNIVDAPDAGTLIDGIKVRSWDFKTDGAHWRYGMVAQELLEVVPEAVDIPEDEEMMMGVDYSKLVPMLVKELQSLRARVAQLEGN